MSRIRVGALEVGGNSWLLVIVLQCDLLLKGFLVGQVVKNLSASSGDRPWVGSLGWKDSLEKGMATHSSILAWRIPWIEEPGRLHSLGLQRVEDI